MSDERRQHPRAFAHIPVELKAASFGDLARDETSDLSKGGMFLKTNRPLAVGDTVSFRIVTEREGGLIEGQGRVVRVTPDGVGVSFEDMKEPYRSMLHALVALHAQSKGPG